MKDDDYLEWIRRQPSCVSGEFEEFVHGEGRSVAAHVRRASNAGTGYKPPFSAVPLSDREHKLTHQHGESALMPSEWFDEQAEMYFKRWKEEMGYES